MFLPVGDLIWALISDARKPLALVPIPKADQLREDAAAVLAVGLVLLVEVWLARQPGGPPPEWAGAIEMLGVVASACGALLAGAWFLCYAVPGGRVVLSREGAEFHCRGLAAFCPWAMFRVEGRAPGWSPRGTLVPIRPREAGQAKLLRGGLVVDTGRGVRTGSFRFASDRAVLLRDPCRGSAPWELAALLHDVGRQLG
jgi:hypothetical protein